MGKAPVLVGPMLGSVLRGAPGPAIGPRVHVRFLGSHNSVSGTPFVFSGRSVSKCRSHAPSNPPQCPGPEGLFEAGVASLGRGWLRSKDSRRVSRNQGGGGKVGRNGTLGPG